MSRPFAIEHRLAKHPNVLVVQSRENKTPKRACCSELLFIVIVPAWPRAVVLQISRPVVLAGAVHAVGVTRPKVRQARRQLRAGGREKKQETRTPQGAKQVTTESVRLGEYKYRAVGHTAHTRHVEQEEIDGKRGQKKKVRGTANTRGEGGRRQ